MFLQQQQQQYISLLGEAPGKQLQEVRCMRDRLPQVSCCMNGLC
jgi:hypothetical protein